MTSPSKDSPPRAASPVATALRFAPGLLIFACLVIFALESWTIRPQIDDAYISYRYARNLVEGAGLVFNPGEYVEGYTNLLWTLLVALGMKLGFAAVEVGHALGFASGLAALWIAYLYARTGLEPGRVWIAPFASMVLLASSGFAYWSMSGLETALFVATVTATLTFEARDRMGLATLAACVATATRPDGGLVACVIFAFQLAAHWREGWRAWRWPLAYAGFLALLTLFRLAYYGDPLPNTYYAKVGGVPWHYGGIYFHRFFFDGAIWLILPALFAPLGSPRLRPGFVYVVLTLLYVFRIGGDAFPLYRFLLPVLVCMAVLAVRGAEAAYRASPTAGIALAMSIPIAICWSVFDAVPLGWLLALGVIGGAWLAALVLDAPRLLAAACALVAVGALAFVPMHGFGGMRERLADSKRARAIATQNSNNRYSEGHQIRRAKIFLKDDPPPKLIATSSVGVLGYHSRLPLLDIVGIVNPEIARSEPDEVEGVFLIPGHQRSNVAYVLSRKPDYIVTPRPWTGLYIAAFAAIWNHPEVARDYEWLDELSAYRRKPSAR